MDLKGRTLKNRYVVQETLGQGGMGTVYRARDTEMDRDVVVKVPRAEFLAVDGFRERFAHEVESLKTLEHPHIVPALDVGEVDGTPFLVLRHLSGGSLKERLATRHGRLLPKEVLPWLRAVSGALDAIHAQGVLHRDIKPDNILFDPHDHPYLADFGIAKAVGRDFTGLTDTGIIPGTPEYMGPETARDEPVGPAYDQYALAVVVYEALSGALPHAASTPLALLIQKGAKPPDDLASRAPHVAPPVTQVVMKALAMNPSDRYPSCLAFADAFKAATAAPTASRPMTQGGRIPASAARARKRTPKVVVALVAAGIVAAALVGARERRDASAGAPLPAVRATKTAPERVVVGELFDVTYRLANEGEGAALEILLRDDLPDGLETEDGHTFVTFAVSRLDPGESPAHVVRCVARREGSFASAAAIGFLGGETHTDPAGPTAIGAPPARRGILALKRTAPATATLGESFDIVYDVSNTGSAAFEGAEVSERLPTGLETADGASEVSLRVERLAPAASRQVSARCRARQGGTFELRDRGKGRRGLGAVGPGVAAGARASAGRDAGGSEPWCGRDASPVHREPAQRR